MSTKKHAGENANPEGDTILMERTQVPRKYAVIIHNDDFTPQEFVVVILERFFSKSIAEAHQLMLKVHKQGKARAGIYPKDLAESKVQQVTSFAREQNHPLKLSCEPE